VGLEGRLLHPMIGGAAPSWDERLTSSPSALLATIAAHGPDSVAFYVSGQLLTEDYYVANKLMKGFIGSGNIDTNSRPVHGQRGRGAQPRFRRGYGAGTYDDLERRISSCWSAPTPRGAIR
jgi:assimilatory nitrate reductase catalytic subunit